MVHSSVKDSVENSVKALNDSEQMSLIQTTNLEVSMFNELFKLNH